MPGKGNGIKRTISRAEISERWEAIFRDALPVPANPSALPDRIHWTIGSIDERLGQWLDPPNLESRLTIVDPEVQRIKREFRRRVREECARFIRGESDHAPPLPSQ
jgi:hypothetical protein